jgi:hypothetical protein
MSRGFAQSSFSDSPKISRACEVPFNTLTARSLSASSVSLHVEFLVVMLLPVHGMLIPAVLCDSDHSEVGFFSCAVVIVGRMLLFNKWGGFAFGLGCAPLGHWFPIPSGVWRPSI